MSFSPSGDQRSVSEIRKCDKHAEILRERWGSFVSIKRHVDGRVSVVRDPSGLQPCYFMEADGAFVFSSDVDLLVKGGFLTPAIDWAVLGETLLFPGNFHAATALRGVTELLPGEQATITRNGISIGTVWSPWDIVVDVKMTYEDATRELRGALETVHRGLSSVSKQSLVTVSGGLDSSIIAALTSRDCTKTTLVTFYTDDPYGDERRYAQGLAEHLKCELLVLPYVAPELETCLTMRAFLPRPTNRGLAMGVDSTLRKLACKEESCMIFNGYGGDNVFCSLRSARPLSDAILHGRSLKLAGRVSRSLANLTGASYSQIWSAALRGVARALSGSTGYRWPRNSSMLGATLREIERPAILHPWLMRAEATMPGKAAHVASLVVAHNHLERFAQADNVTSVSPLLTSPIVERAISVPTWMWFENDLDRFIARKACSDLLPASLVSRTTKGTPVALHSRFFEAHRKSLGDYLANGLLADRNLLDRDAVARCCKSEGPSRGLDFLRILELVDVESWCRFWTEQGLLLH
ncbi:asparagine synthase [Sphingobium sp. TKS]|nr:asparagine synthase [Sphingobium sp. TKS]